MINMPWAPNLDENEDGTPTESWKSMVGTTSKAIPKGFYKLRQINYMPAFFPFTPNTDTLVTFTNSKQAAMLERTEKFWKSKSKYKAYGLLHRRGYLISGDKGVGKTSLVIQLANQVINNDGVVFYFSDGPNDFEDGLTLFRRAEPDRPIMCVFENIDILIKEYGTDTMLSFFSGTNQMDNVLCVATLETSGPNRYIDGQDVDLRLDYRPREIDDIVRLNETEFVQRVEYFSQKMPFLVNDVEELAKATDGFTLAELAEVIVQLKIQNNSLGDVIENNKRRGRVSTS